jgi:hypothetical protein
VQEQRAEKSVRAAKSAVYRDRPRTLNNWIRLNNSTLQRQLTMLITKSTYRSLRAQRLSERTG